jgi:hypothetical protein
MVVLTAVDVSEDRLTLFHLETLSFFSIIEVVLYAHSSLVTISKFADWYQPFL